MVNAVDDPPNCDFFAMAVVRRGDLQVAISTNGRSPAFARWMREGIERALPAGHSALLELLGDARQQLKARGPIPPYERWEAAITEDLIELISSDRGAAADLLLKRLSDEPVVPLDARPAQRISPLNTRRGRVSLVGAGPGNPDLITVAGLKRLQDADVVAYDRLIHPQLLAEAPEKAERIGVGKSAGMAGWEQDSIERLLIERALRGERVVRLKGGDPFVFGRGAEEVAALVAARIPVEVIPGVTSATSVPALAGIPVTHRAFASAVTFVTAHEDPAKPDQGVDWAWVAQSRGTIVILMGLRRLTRICARLMAEGMDATTPAAVIASGTLPEQQVVSADLETLPARALAGELSSPALIVVGDVVRFPAYLERLGAADPTDPAPLIASLTVAC
jgi:uroporphyrin-III C-methyltransferase